MENDRTLNMLSLNILTLQVICGVSVYMVILLARINARIQALLCKTEKMKGVN